MMTAIMSMPVGLRNDATGALSLLEHGDEDPDLNQHLIAGLRSFLDVV